MTALADEVADLVAADLARRRPSPGARSSTVVGAARAEVGRQLRGRTGQHRAGVRRGHDAHAERRAAVRDDREPAAAPEPGTCRRDRVVGRADGAVLAVGIAVAGVVHHDRLGLGGGDRERHPVEHRGLPAVRLAVLGPRDPGRCGSLRRGVRRVVVELARHLEPQHVVAVGAACSASASSGGRARHPSASPARPRRTG